MSGLLNKTKCYLVGHMEYENGSQWREKITENLLEIGVMAFDPYKKPFIDDSTDESQLLINEFRGKIKGWDEDQIKTVSEKMKAIRSSDLNLVDRCDFIIANINPRVASWGSAEEIFSGNYKKKPIFVSIAGGKENVPLWLLGTLPYNYFYNSVGEIFDTLKKINSGEIKIDSRRWRLLKPEFR